MAKTASPNVNWQSVLATTTMKYLESGKLRDAVHERSELWKYLRSGKRIKVVTGGERIKLPLMYEGSGNFKRYSGLEVLDVTGFDGQTNAFFDWKQAAAAVVISGLDKRRNQGENRIRDLWKDRVMQVESTLSDELATDAFSDGTANGSKQTTGLAAMIATTVTSGTYADINFGDNTKWRNKVETSVGNPSTNLLPVVRTLMNNCQKVAGVEGAPDLILTTQTLAETLEALALPQVRYSGGGEADLGIQPRYKGARIAWDPKCQSGIGYILNSNHLFMFVHRDANFSMLHQSPQIPINQDAFVAPIIWQGNLATNMRSALGKWTGAT